MKSMTGFGSADGLIDGRALTVELKSLNNRYLEFKIRSPKEYSALEIRIANYLKKFFSRGTIEVSIFHDHSKASLRYKLNRCLMTHYQKELSRALKSLKLSGHVSLDQLLWLPDIWIQQGSTVKAEHLWKSIQKLLYAALQKTSLMRKKEGKNLLIVILNKCGAFEKEVAILAAQKEKLFQKHQVKVQKKLSQILRGVPLDPQRLQQEVLYCVNRSDVSEEVDRLQSHIHQFKKILKRNTPIGKQLDFIIQEMNRELNTIGSKVEDSNLSAHVIEGKTLLEQMREQIQNVE